MKIEDFRQQNQVSYEVFMRMAKSYGNAGSFAYWPSAENTKDHRPLGTDGDAAKYYQPSVGNPAFFNQYLNGHLTKGVVFLGFNAGVSPSEAAGKDIRTVATHHKIELFTNSHDKARMGKSICPFFTNDSPILGAYFSDLFKFMPNEANPNRYAMTGMPTNKANELKAILRHHPEYVKPNLDGLRSELVDTLGVSEHFVLVLMHTGLAPYRDELSQIFNQALITTYPHFADRVRTPYHTWSEKAAPAVKKLNAEVIEYIASL